MKTQLHHHTVRHLRISPAVCLSPESPLRDAVARMQTERMGCVLICRNESVIGILTEVDVLRKGGTEAHVLAAPLSMYMTSSPVCITSNSSVWEAAKKMKEGTFRHLPVVDEKGKPEGYISVRSIVTYFADHFSETVYTLPPDPDNIPTTAEGA